MKRKTVITKKRRGPLCVPASSGQASSFRDRAEPVAERVKCPVAAFQFPIASF